MNGPIDDELGAFIHADIHSVEQLEILLLLRRERHRLFTSGEVARELRVHPDSVALRLEDLVARRLASHEGDRFQYAPSGHRLERAVDRLATAYADARVAVIQHIFSKPSDALQSFVEAFKLRRR